jgi:cytochrome b561
LARLGCVGEQENAMPSRYDAVAIVLHWSIASLILVAFGLGLTVDDFPKAFVPVVVNAHALIGLAVLALTFVRLAWRITHRPPPLPASTGHLTERLSKIAHGLLYLLMIAVPLIGLPTLFYRGKGLDFGLVTVPQFLPRVPEIFHPLTEVHELGAYALVLLAAGHAAAAIYHQLVLRDGLVLRMTLGRKQEVV